jgi:hypothetical protein
MQSYSAKVGGLLLHVRETEFGWESSVAGPSTVMNQDTAKALAERFASELTNQEISGIDWQYDWQDDLPEIEGSKENNPFFPRR